MTLYNFKEFIDNLIVENLHPELQSIVASPAGYQSKHSLITKKIKDLSTRGEETGIEGNMPKGSSRAYIPHSQPHHTIIDNEPASFKVGTKVAIKSNLDKYHRKDEHGGQSIGQLQNRVENADWYVNKKYRVLTQKEDKTYETNEDGIFPPLVEHDHDKHEWSQVGQARNLVSGDFKKITKTLEHPSGISHDDLCQTLERDWHRDHGKYWAGSPSTENHLDHVEKHPLVQKFLNHQRETATPPHDYRQKKNMGVFEHPNGSKYIVARDHGYDKETMEAYRDARKRKYRIP